MSLNTKLLDKLRCATKLRRLPHILQYGSATTVAPQKFAYVGALLCYRHFTCSFRRIIIRYAGIPQVLGLLNLD